MKRVGIAALALALLAVACSGDSRDQPAPQVAAGPTTAPQEPTPTTAVPVPTTAAPVPTTTTLPPPVPCPISAAAPSGDAAESVSLIDEITDRGVVRVGVQPGDRAPFFFCVNGEYAGFEAALIRLLVEGTVGTVEIAWVPLSSADRFNVLREGGVDFVVRNTTVTPDRRDLVDFTTPYLMDGPAVIVPIGAGVTDLAGLAELRIAVVAGTTMETDLTRLLGDAGVVFDVVLTEPSQQPATLVETGDADAYVDAWTQGIVRATHALDVVVIPLAFTDGISAFTSPTEPEFGAVLEEQLRNLIDTGMWATAYKMAFGFPPPWTTQEMAASG